MALQVIIGRAGSGKTTVIFDQIKRRLTENPLGTPLIYLVPEQATFQAEYALATKTEQKGIVRVDVSSFERLSTRILEELGGMARLPVDEMGKQMVLRLLLEQNREQLQVFHRSASQPGFAAQLASMISECKQYGVDAQILEQQAVGEGTLTQKLHDMSVLMNAYQNYLTDRSYYDADDVYPTVAGKIPDSRYIRESEIWLDGFSGFTQQEYMIIEQLLRHGKQVTVALSLDPNERDARVDDLATFYPTLETYQSLIRLAQSAGVEVEEPIMLEGTRRFQYSPWLSRIEESFAVRNRFTKKGGYDSRRKQANLPSAARDNEVTLTSAVNRRAEVQGVALRMLALAREDGYRWRDMAVMLRELDTYADEIASVFDEYEIPYFLDRKRAVMHHPVVELVRSSLEAVAFAWKYEAVFRCLKTDLITPRRVIEESVLSENENGNDEAGDSIDVEVNVDVGGVQTSVDFELFYNEQTFRDEIDLLENYVLAYGIDVRHWNSEEPWKLHYQATGYEQIDEIRRRYSGPLRQFEKALRKAAKVDVRAMTTVLYEFLCDLGVPQKLEEWKREAERPGRSKATTIDAVSELSDQQSLAEHNALLRKIDLEAAREHEQVWSGLMDLLDQIVEVMGAEKIDVPTYARILDSGLESIRLGLVPPALDQVLIGSMERSRQPDVRAVFILGVNDGVIPLRPKEDGLLDEAERERLEQSGISLAPGAKRKLMMENYLLYQALTRPSERLWLSCALADGEGKALLPSSVLEDVKKALPGLTIGFFHNEPTNLAENDYSLLGRPKQVFAHLLTLIRQMKKGTPLSPFWQEVYNWYVEQSPNARMEKWLLKGLTYSNQVMYLPRPTSRTLYGDDLKLSVSRLERFQACPFQHFSSHGLRLKQRQTHKLERFDVGELFHQSLKLAVERMRQNHLDWSGLTEEGSMRLADLVVSELVPQTRSSILDSSARYRFVQSKLKRAVGRAITVLGEHAKRSKFAPIGLEIDFGPGREIPGLTLTLANGVNLTLIGRIDRIDQSLEANQCFLRVIDYKSGPKTLQLSDVYNGLNLQLLVYLDVVLSNSEEWLGRRADVGGVFYYQVADPFVTAKRIITPDEVEKQRQAKLKMKGLMLADPMLAQLMDEATTSGNSDILPFGFKKDGSFTAYSSVATRDQFGTLQEFVRHTIKNLGQRMTEGEIAITPYTQGPYVACQTCDYKSFCQFDKLMNSENTRNLTKLKDNQVWPLLEMGMGFETLGATGTTEGEGGGAND
ncbi:PD-(D/E)XK nuclease family protein [Brevibacillus dissolubilis]|uniref:PD-(D/E)XK nuclease family protein n=1 Tax=Brevibacillus dissolubilis TaxID=1844116 RepID=UPI0011165B12|nr:PD-(D/E)XK nuclease family protein [Brevibacillus dissolubilis]